MGKDGHIAVSQSLQVSHVAEKETPHIRLTSCFLHPRHVDNNSKISHVRFNLRVRTLNHALTVGFVKKLNAEVHLLSKVQVLKQLINFRQKALPFLSD